MKLKQIKEILNADTYSIKNGVVTVRKAFYYRHGKTASDFEKSVINAIPSAKILESGEHWASFRGGASVANSSHWFVKFTV